MFNVKRNTEAQQTELATAHLDLQTAHDAHAAPVPAEGAAQLGGARGREWLRVRGAGRGADHRSH